MLKLQIIPFSITDSDYVIYFIATLFTYLRLVTAAEFCQFEQFNATCRPGEVILIEEARYGRLQLGRCVTKDYGYLGCSADVLAVLDRACSGRQWCLLGVAFLREIVQPCPGDLTSYLEASYLCVEVLDLKSPVCNTTLYLTNPSIPPTLTPSSNSGPSAAQNSLYIASGHGWNDDMAAVVFTASCPLQIIALSGQKINFTLYSFPSASDPTHLSSTRYYPAGVLPGDENRPQARLRFCPAHVFISEWQEIHGSPLCPRHQVRLRHLLTSRGHVVSVYFSQQYRKLPVVSRSGIFILRVEAVGCGDVKVSAGMWVERQSDRAVIGCNNTQEAWYLMCRQNKWVGPRGNCAASSEAAVLGDVETSDPTVTQGLLLAVIVGVVLGLTSGFVMLCILYSHKNRALRRRRLQLKPRSVLSDNNHSTLYTDTRHEDAFNNIICSCASELLNTCPAWYCPSALQATPEHSRRPLGFRSSTGRPGYTQMIELQCRECSSVEASPIKYRPVRLESLVETESDSIGEQPSSGNQRGNDNYNQGAGNEDDKIVIFGYTDRTTPTYSVQRLEDVNTGTTIYNVLEQDQSRYFCNDNKMFKDFESEFEDCEIVNEETPSDTLNYSVRIIQKEDKSIYRHTNEQLTTESDRKMLNDPLLEGSMLNSNASVNYQKPEDPNNCMLKEYTGLITTTTPGSIQLELNQSVNFFAQRDAVPVKLADRNIERDDTAISPSNLSTQENHSRPSIFNMVSQVQHGSFGPKCSQDATLENKQHLTGSNFNSQILQQPDIFSACIDKL